MVLGLVGQTPAGLFLTAAAHHSALNLGNSLGAVLGGAVIGAGFGYLVPTWVGLALCVPGIALAVFGAVLTRNARHAPASNTLTPAEASAN